MDPGKNPTCPQAHCPASGTQHHGSECWPFCFCSYQDHRIPHSSQDGITLNTNPYILCGFVHHPGKTVSHAPYCLPPRESLHLPRSNPCDVELHLFIYGINAGTVSYSHRLPRTLHRDWKTADTKSTCVERIKNRKEWDIRLMNCTNFIKTEAVLSSTLIPPYFTNLFFPFFNCSPALT